MRGTVRSRVLVLGLLLVGLCAVVPAGAQVMPQIFSDVPPTFWAFTQIESMTAAGTIRGYSTGEFGPGDFVTRAQLAVFLDRVIQSRGRMGWAQPGPVANSILVTAPAGAGAPLADFMLLRSTDGVTFTTATATLLGVDTVSNFATWQVNNVTQTTYFLPVVMINDTQVPLSSVIQARPQETTATLAIVMPVNNTTSQPRLPLIRWNAPDSPMSTVLYVVNVDRTGATNEASRYEAGLEGWRTSVLLNSLRGPGIVFATAPDPFFPDPLAASTGYTVTVLAVDAAGWAFARGANSFTTGP